MLYMHGFECKIEQRFFFFFFNMTNHSVADVACTCNTVTVRERRERGTDRKVVWLVSKSYVFLEWRCTAAMKVESIARRFEPTKLVVVCSYWLLYLTTFANIWYARSCVPFTAVGYVNYKTLFTYYIVFMQNILTIVNVTFDQSGCFRALSVAGKQEMI